MSKVLTIFTEDAFAVIGLVLFAALVYNLLGIVLRRYFGRGRTRTFFEKRMATGHSLLNRLFPENKVQDSPSRKEFSKNVSSRTTFSGRDN